MKKSCTLVLCILMAALLHGQTNNAAKTKWLKQQDTVYNFSFEYPENWTLKLPGTNTRFFVTSMPENEQDDFRENINCIVRVMNDSTFILKNAEAAILQSLKNSMDSFQLIRNEWIKWNNTDAFTLEYTFKQKDETAGLTIHMYQQMAIVNNRLFTLSYTAKKVHYAKYAAVIKKIIASLRIYP